MDISEKRFDEQEQELVELRARVAELEKELERHRWLRIKDLENYTRQLNEVKK